MIELTETNTAKAIERCKQLKPKVRFVADRVFEVSSARNENVLSSSFDVQNGKKLAECHCKASEKGLICYHIIAGATAKIYRQSLKRQAVQQ